MHRVFTSALAIVAAFTAIVATTVAHAQENPGPVKITMTTIDVPGAALTAVNGINSLGEMVGWYGQSPLGSASGFTYSGGAFAHFAYPGQSVTIPGGINDAGVVAGLATQVPGRRSTVVGFLYDGVTFTTLKDGSEAVTNVYGINNSESVVGSDGRSVGAWTAFQEIGGVYTAVGLPGACTYKDATGINNLGEIVGATYCGLYNYGYAVRGGKIEPIQYPGSSQTVPLGINDLGVIVGWYGVGGNIYGFAYSNGKYFSFSYPGAKYTSASGINNSGQVVGWYSSDIQTSSHGFVTSPITETSFEGPQSSSAAKPQ